MNRVGNIIQPSISASRSQSIKFAKCLYHLPLTWTFSLHFFHFALAGVAQWTECQPVNQKVIGLIPSQGTCLG